MGLGMTRVRDSPESDESWMAGPDIMADQGRLDRNVEDWCHGDDGSCETTRGRKQEHGAVDGRN